HELERPAPSRTTHHPSQSLEEIMKKLLAIGGLAVASAVVLAGCTTGGGDTPSGEGVELVIWTDAEREQAITDAAAAFEEETGATVTLVQKNFEDLRADFIAQVPTGEGPDITVGA